jgi:hypothetical protein
MALSKDYVIVTFAVKRDLMERFKAMEPRYGRVSHILRSLFEAYVRGKLWGFGKEVKK